MVFFFAALPCLQLYAQQDKPVSPEVMQEIYEEVKTPYKYGLVLVAENNSKKVDCPSVFRRGDTWYMTYIVFDGRGYETWLANSVDLLHWNVSGRLLSVPRDTSTWDGNQRAGYIALQDYTWGGNYEIKQYKEKYWMSFIGGSTPGYEAGDLSIGIAYTAQSAHHAREWERLPSPVLTSNDNDVRWWENKKLFKSTIIWDKDKTTGSPFVMFYNANGDTTGDKKLRWFERIGMAVSNDMVHWKRFINDPVVQHPVGITGDPYIQKIGKVWVMFYFGAFWQNNNGAFNRFACSYDLVNWTDWMGDDLIKSSEPFDEKFAHKPYIIKHNGVVYHFYNAVNNEDQRGIAVATSVDKGKSTLEFSPN